jgi:hypothetical protein
METTISVDFPKPVYQRLQRQARVMNIPIHEVVVQIVRHRLPLWLETIPPDLFNPNAQNWSDHFRWSEDGTIIIGLTACGRATVGALQLNNQYMVRARKFWFKANEHPPRE